MSQHRNIIKVVITTAAGREIVVEGAGAADLITTKTEGRPSACLQVTMPIPARLEQGDGGKYVKTDVVL